MGACFRTLQALNSASFGAGLASAPRQFPAQKGLLRPSIINLAGPQSCRAAYAEPAPKEVTSDFGNRFHGHSTPRRLREKPNQLQASIDPREQCCNPSRLP